MILPKALVLLLNIGWIGCHIISSLATSQNVRMTPVLFKMMDVNAGYLKLKLDLLKRWHPKYARKIIQHASVDRIDKSVPPVSVWHHSAEPHDAKPA